VQIGLGAIESDVDLVASQGDIFDVKGLVDVADEVDNELQCLLLLKNGDVLFKGTAGVVCNGGDDAPLFRAVPLVVDTAGLGWVVERILG
jgi:hypothetical protein